MSSTPTPPPLKIVALCEIVSVFDQEAVLETVRRTLIDHAHGRTSVATPIHLNWADDADCHVKVGYLRHGHNIAIKIASSVYSNPGRGLPSNFGLVVLLDKLTGAPRAVLADQGWITAWRTAAVGALASHYLSAASAHRVVVFGSGQQAELQVLWLRRLRPISTVHIVARHAERGQALAARLRAGGIPDVKVSSAERALAESDIVITATASATPLFDPSTIRDGTHITALGADMPGKHELPEQLIGRAELIVTDDPSQSIHHGDVGYAVRAGLVSPDKVAPLGLVLDQETGRASDQAVTVADLTGIAALDAAVSELLITRLEEPRPHHAEARGVGQSPRRDLAAFRRGGGDRDDGARR